MKPYDSTKATRTLVTRSAKVNRARTLKEVIVATGRTAYLDNGVLSTIPHGVDDEVEMSFYFFGWYVAPDKLDEKLADRGLGLIVDPVGQAAINEADREFADLYPNGTYWKDADGNWCGIFFTRWGGIRRVYVNKPDCIWPDNRWFPVCQLST